jgi:hypothetical protein
METSLDCREGQLCLLVITDKNRPGTSEPCYVRQWYPIRDALEDDARVLRGRLVTCADRDAGLYADEEGEIYSLKDGSGTCPIYSETIPAKGEPMARPKVTRVPNDIGQGGGNELHPKTRQPRKRREEHGGMTDRQASDLHANTRELNLREKFVEVRRRLGYIQKRGHNELRNYSYILAADLAGSVGDILAELGVVVIPQLQSISTETPRSSTERIAKIIMNYRFFDTNSGEELTVRVAGEGADVGDKAPYKAMTGALKYALLQSFLLASGDDPEDERALSEAAPGPERLVSQEQVSELRQLIEETGTELERVLAYYKVARLSDLTESSYRRALELLNRKLAKQNQENGIHAQN